MISILKLKLESKNKVNHFRRRGNHVIRSYFLFNFNCCIFILPSSIPIILVNIYIMIL